MTSDAGGAHDLDLRSAEVRHNPYPYYRHLRRHHPVAFLERMNWYAVTLHDDVEHVLRTPADFSSTIMRGADRALLGQDPPVHTAVRKLVARVFNAKRIGALERRVALTARRLVHTLAATGRGDFVRDCAVELPVRIIAHLIGVEEYILPEVKRWSEAVVMGASQMVPPGEETEFARRGREFDQYLGDLLRYRRQRPGNDIVSELLHAPDSDLLSDADVRSLVKLLVIAGNETTTNLMSNAMLALFATPGLQERLRRDPCLCSAWVEETLRYDAPVQIVLRRANEDAVLRGVRIPKGGVLALVIGSANRDERHHLSPDTFDIGRSEPHLTFGSGPHYCLGSWLARLEATIGLSALLETTRHVWPIENLADIPTVLSLHLRGPRHLFIELTL